MPLQSFDLACARELSSCATDPVATMEALGYFVSDPSVPLSVNLVTRMAKRAGLRAVERRQRVGLLEAACGAVTQPEIDLENAHDLMAEIDTAIDKFKGSKSDKFVCAAALRLQGAVFKRCSGLIKPSAMTVLRGMVDDVRQSSEVREAALNNVDIVVASVSQWANNSILFGSVKTVASSDPDLKVRGAALTPLSTIAITCNSDDWTKEARNITVRGQSNRNESFRIRAKEAEARIAAYSYAKDGSYSDACHL